MGCSRGVRISSSQGSLSPPQQPEGEDAWGGRWLPPTTPSCRYSFFAKREENGDEVASKKWEFNSEQMRQTTICVVCSVQL